MLVVPDESNFINQYLNELSSRSVRFGQDYTSRQLPKPLKIKRSPLTPSQPTTTDASNEQTINLTIKILKPASQLTISGISLNDTIEDLKERIHKQKSEVTISRQRLLLKGKVLSDNNKTLGDYGLTDKATLNLMLMAAAAAAAAPSKQAETTTDTKFGLTVATEKKLEDPAFWDSLKSSVQALVENDKDTDILITKFKELTQ